MSAMFRNCKAFNADRSQWNTCQVTNMTLMFDEAHSFMAEAEMLCVGYIKVCIDDPSSSVEKSAKTVLDTYGDEVDVRLVAALDSRISILEYTSSLISASGMFEGATCLNQDIGTGDTSPVYPTCKECSRT
jgi:surface protein